MARRSFISKAFGKLKEIFFGLTSGKSSASRSSDASRSTNIPLGTQRRTTPTVPVVSSAIGTDSQFVFDYSDELKREIESMSAMELASSASVMPETLTPTSPEFVFAGDYCKDIHSFITVFKPTKPDFRPTIDIYDTRKRYIANKLLVYRSRLADVDRYVRIKRFEEASHINEDLIASIENLPQFNECLKQAIENISVITAAKYQFEREEEERRIREEQERKRLEKERQHAEKKKSLLSDISKMVSFAEKEEWEEGDSLKVKLLAEVQAFSESEVSFTMIQATGKYDEKLRHYLAKKEREKREAAERQAREEQERIRKENERIRIEKRQSLEEGIVKLEKLTQNSLWTDALSLKEELLIDVPTFHDAMLSEKLASVVSVFERKYSAYRVERERLETEQRERAEQEKKLREQEIRNKQINDAKGLIVAFEKATISYNWSECSRIKQELDNVVVSLYDDDLTCRYDTVITRYNAAIRLHEQIRRENEERERLIRQEQERREIEEKKRRAREAEAERQRQVRSQYIQVKLSNHGECLCIHEYYPKNAYGSNVTHAQQNVRDTVYSFKDKFNDKSITQRLSARTTVSNAVCSVINKLYPGEQHNLWFCTAQASTPEAAKKRFKEFCQMVSTASGIHDGFELITVTGVKASASTGGGTRGDISNLSFDSNKIKGKRIILFDDIITSGKTMGAIRNKLLDNGAISVDCIAYGKTVR